ncbi:MAG TPA: hypothetical protein VKC53_00560 [Patescibacteria group bacterium]|nr:hypothetical protein [Patescibacteria group bacterium]
MADNPFNNEFGTPQDPSFGIDKGSQPRHYERQGQQNNDLLGAKEFMANPAGKKKEPEGDPQLEEANSRQYRGGESLRMEMITNAEYPSEFYYGLRKFEARIESGTIPRELADHYTPTRVLDVMIDRAEVLNMTIEDLKERGWLESYDPNTGIGEPRKAKFGSTALSVDQKDIRMNGQVVGYKTEYNYGTDEDRTELANAYERGILEFESRIILDSRIGIRLRFRDDLNGLTESNHLGASKLRVEHIEEFLNLPSEKELVREKAIHNKEGKRLHELGDQIEEAIWWNLAMLNSETPEQMQAFINKPATEGLMIKRLMERRGLKYDEAWEFLKEQLGDWKKWTKSIDRTLKPVKNEKTGKVIITETLDQENRGIRFVPRKDEKGKIVEYVETPNKVIKNGVEKIQKLRGPVTELGNIAGRGKLNLKKENGFIKYIGELVGTGKIDRKGKVESIDEASWLAATFLRAAGVYSSEGYVYFENGEFALALGEGQFISSDDLGKFLVYLWNLKEGLAGRPSGLKDLIGRIPDMATSLMDFSQVAMLNEDGKEIMDKDSEGNDKIRTRSLFDAWLGTAAGVRTNLLTGEPTNIEIPEEPYNRLGDLNFESLQRDFHGNFDLIQWLSGRDERGVLDALIKVDFRLEDFSLNGLKKMWKYFNIVYNVLTLTKGSMHKYDISDDKDKIVVKNVFDNMNAARIKSASFATNVLNSVVKLFNPDLGQNNLEDVSAARIAEINIQAVSDGNPKTEEEVIKNFEDENKKFRTTKPLAKNGEVIADAEKRLTKQVGIFIGKKK